MEDVLKNVWITYTARRNNRDDCWEVVRHANGQNGEVVQTNIPTEKKAEKAQWLWRARQRGDA